MPSLHDVSLTEPVDDDKKKDKKKSLYEVPAVTPPGTNFDITKDRDPETEGKVQRLSEAMGQTPEVIREDPAAFEATDRVQKAQSLANQHEGLGMFAENRDDAALIGDDAEALAELEKTVVDPVYESYQRFDPEYGINEDVVKAGKSIAKQAGKLVPGLAKNITDAVAWVSGTMESGARAIEQIPTVGPSGGNFGDLEQLSLEGSKAVKKVLDAEVFQLPPEKQGKLIDNPQYWTDPEWMAYNVGEVGRSLVPVLIATYIGGPLVGATMGSIMEGGDLYTQLREQGVSDTNAANASYAFGVVVGVLNKFSLDRWLKEVPVGNKLARTFHRIVTGGTEAGTEYLEEPFQAAFAAIAQGKDFDGVVADVIDSTTNIEVVPGSFLLGFGLNTSIADAVAKKDRAAGYLEHQQKINEAVNLTKTKERSPEAIKRFLKTAGLGDEAFLTGDGLWELYQSDPKTAKEILEKVDVNVEEALDAARAGQTVQVATSSLHAVLSPEEFALISDDLKPSPGAYSQKEIQDQTSTDEINRLTELYAEAEKNEEEFESELKRTGDQVRDSVTGLSKFEGVDVEEHVETVVDFQRRKAHAAEVMDGIDRVDYLKRVQIEKMWGFGIGGFADQVNDPFNFTFLKQEGKDPAAESVEPPESEFPGTESDNAAKEFNAEYAGHSLRFEGVWNDWEGKPNIWQYTPHDGPLRGATFGAAGPGLEAMKTAYKNILTVWKEEITFEQQGLDPAEHVPVYTVVYAEAGRSQNMFRDIDKAREEAAAVPYGAHIMYGYLERDPETTDIYSVYAQDHSIVTQVPTRVAALAKLEELGPGHFFEVNAFRTIERYEVVADNGSITRTFKVDPTIEPREYREHAQRVADETGGWVRPVFFHLTPKPSPGKIESWMVFDGVGEAYDQFPHMEDAIEAAKNINGYAEPKYEPIPIEDNPDVLMDAAKSRYTLKMFDDPMLKGKEGKQVKLETIVQVTRQKGTPKVVKDVVGQVMVNEMQLNPEQGEEVHKFLTDGKTTPMIQEEVLDVTVDYDVFKATVEGALMPLEPIDTSKWADYGLSNLGYRHGDYDKVESMVYNSPIPHGFGDHFNDMFETHKRNIIREWEIKEVPQRPGVFVAMDVNRPATNDPIELLPYIGGGGSKAQVEKWIEEYNTRTLIEKAGVFGHVRRMDIALVRFLSEMQADPFQKKNIAQLLTEFVLEYPETRAQKRLKNKIEKAKVKAMEAPALIRDSLQEANEYMDKVRTKTRYINKIKGRKKKLERQIAKAEEAGVVDRDGIMWVERGQGKRTVLLYAKKKLEEFDDLIGGQEEVIAAHFKSIEKISEGHKARQISTRQLESLVEQKKASIEELKEIKDVAAVPAASVTPEQVQLREERQAEVENNIARLNELIQEHQNEKALVLTDFKKQYEKLFYATQKIDKMEASVPEVFTPIQKQFTAHRKNYTERLLREEIRAAAEDGMEHLRVGTMRTVAVVEGYIRIRARNTEVGEFNGMYEVTHGDPDSLETGDTIEYLDEEWTVVDTDNGHSYIEVVRSDEVSTFSVWDFHNSEMESRWDNTQYELDQAPEFTVHVTRIVPEDRLEQPDRGEQLLPGMPEPMHEPLEQPEPEGVEIYRDNDYIYSYETDLDPNEWYGDVRGGIIIEKAIEHVESDIGAILDSAAVDELDESDDLTEYDMAYSTEIDYTGDIDSELYDYVEEQIREEYEDANDVAQYWADATGESTWGQTGDDTVYYSSGDSETLPVPRDVEEEPLDDEEMRVEEEEEKEEFDLDDVQAQYHVILKKYDETGKLMKKLYPDSYKMVKDEKGWWWHEIEVDPAEKDKPIQLFQAGKSARGSVITTDNNGVNSYTINILKKSDPSTIIHELGHIFLLELENHVHHGRVSDTTMRDYKAILKYVGAPDDGKLRREHHEKFAEAFEVYTLEGKSPSLDMERSFARMRRWMTELYKNASNLENVKMTGQIRGIFDRMLKVETDIAKAANAHGITEKTQKELDALGVIPEDQRYMKRLIADAKVEAENKMHKAMVKGHRANKKIWLAEATAMVDANPIYKVMAYLQKAGALSTSMLSEAYGADILELIPQVWHRQEGGVHPDLLAFQFNFNSGETLLGQLLVAPKRAEAIKQIYDRKKKAHDAEFKAEDYLFDTVAFRDYLTIVNRYYDSPIAEEEVDPAVKADGKPRKKPATPKTVSRQKMKKYAKRVMDTKAVRDAIRVDRYMGAMKKAQNQERIALLAGDMLAAAQAAEKIRFNYEMASLAKKNRERVDASLKFTKKVAGSTSIQLPYREQIRQLVFRFDLAEGVAPQRPDNLKPLVDMISGNEYAGSSAFPASDFLLNETFKDYHDLSMAEFTEVTDLLRYLTGQGRDAQKAFLMDGKTRVEDAAADSAEESMHLPAKGIRDRFSILRGLEDTVRKGFSKLDSLNFVMIAKGAYQNVGRKGVRSRTEELILDPLIKAQTDRDVMHEMIAARMQPRLDQIRKTMHEWQKKYGRKIRIKNVQLPSVYEDVGQAGYWTAEQIFAVVLNLGNDSNVSRLTKGYPTLTPKKIEALLNMLSVDDMVAVQGIWDTINSLYADLDAVHTRMNYFHMNKIEARPFTFKGKKFNGGYYPVHFDPRLSDKVATFSESDDLLSRSEAVRQVPATRSGMTQARKEGVALPLNLSLGVITRHINDTAHYITHAEAVRDVHRITKNEVFAAETKRLLGKDVYEMVLGSIRHIARPVRQPADPDIDRWIEAGRRATTAFILGLNASVAAKQMFSSPAAAFDMGPIHYVKGFMNVVNQGADSVAMMRELSPYMRQRAKSMDRELQDFFNSMKPDAKALWFGDKSVTWDDVRNFGFAPIRWVDMATVTPIWWGAYNKELTNSNGDLDAAVKYADDIVRRTQPSAQALDLTGWQRAGGAARLWSLFQTFTIGKYGQRQRLHYRAMKAGAMSKSEYAWFNATDVILPGLAMQMMFAFLWGKDFEDEETQKSIVWEVVKYGLTTGIPFAGSFFGKYGDPLASPIALSAQMVWKAISDGLKYVETHDPADLAKIGWGIAHLSSFVAGVPLSKIVQKAVKGHEQDPGYVPGIEYLIPAPKK